MGNLSKSELLNYALQNGMISLDTIQAQFEMDERKKYLDMHVSRIWQSTDGKWYTYLPNGEKRRLIKRSTKENLEDAIYDFYKNDTDTQTLEKTFWEWVNKKLKFGEISKQTADRYEVDFYRYFGTCKDRDIRFFDEDFLDDLILTNIRLYRMKSKAWGNMRLVLKGTMLFASKKRYTDFKITEYLNDLDLSRKIFNHDRKPTENVIFQEKEVEQIIQHIEKSNSLNDIAILFAIYTGMRVGEIVALKWEDICIDQIHVNRTQIKYKDENGKIIHEIRDFPKTEAGIRDVVVLPELKAVIKRLRKINPFTEYLFEKKGECIHKHSVATRLYNLCDKFGFPRKGMHSLRRYYATKLINAGIEEAIIISQMGHTDFKTTKTYYYKDNSEKEYVVQRVASAFTL